VIRTTSAANVATIDDPTFGTSTGLHDTEFVQTGSGHAIEITAAGTYNFQDLTFTGYNAADGQSDSAVYCSAGSGTITINVNGGNAPSVRAPGMTIDVVTGVRTVTARAVTTTGTAIQDARVLLKATATTGSLPVDDTVTISNAGTTATVTHTTHGLSTGDKVLINGASEQANNGVHTITVTTASEYTYTMGSSPSSPTGTITSTFVFIYDLTDVNGEATMSRSFVADQSCDGWARKATSSPLYKQGPIVGTVSSSENTTFTGVLISDE